MLKQGRVAFGWGLSDLVSRRAVSEHDRKACFSWKSVIGFTREVSYVTAQHVYVRVCVYIYMLHLEINININYIFRASCSCGCCTKVPPARGPQDMWEAAPRTSAHFQNRGVAGVGSSCSRICSVPLPGFCWQPPPSVPRGWVARRPDPAFIPAGCDSFHTRPTAKFSLSTTGTTVVLSPAPPQPPRRTSLVRKDLACKEVPSPGLRVRTPSAFRGRHRSPPHRAVTGARQPLFSVLVCASPGGRRDNVPQTRWP